MKVFHGLVWTERALKFGEANPSTLQDFAARRPLWGALRVPHVVIAPSNTDATCNTLFGHSPKLILGPATPIHDLGSQDFDRYCLDTLLTGIGRLISAVPVRHFEGPLGVIGDDSEAAEDLIEELTDSGTVGFVKWQLDDGRFYYGPSLVQLAGSYLIAEGVRLDRVAFVTSVQSDVTSSADTALLADVYAGRSGRSTIVATMINVGNEPIGGLAKEGATVFGGVGKDVIIDLGGKNPSESDNAFGEFEMAASLSLHPRWRILLRRDELTSKLGQHAAIATANLEAGRARYRCFAKQKLPWNGSTAGLDASFNDLFRHGSVFDHRTGAVCFDGYEWNRIVLNENQPPWDELRAFYSDVLEEPWRRDRPNYRRVLAAPTKVLLRGEDYYANLRNISPAKRIQELQETTEKLVAGLRTAFFDYDTKDRWKLCLGYLDYLRNASLQIAWLENQIGSMYNFKELRSAELTQGVAEFLERVALAYYAVLGGARDVGREQVAQIATAWTSLRNPLARVVTHLAQLASDWKTDEKEVHLEITKLIRRWREADHPGENMLVAMHALEASREPPEPAVGIGWGGIELPIVYRQLACIGGTGGAPAAFAAHYSTYAKHGSKSPNVRPISPGGTLAELEGTSVVLFDDNSLSGRTLQTVREHLLIGHKASADRIFLTRVSGERRYDQMRMDNHGLLDPASIGTSVCGHLGETPFSRAWSRTDYTNPIRVFSLARRRVLELLFSNSSADRFDREGF